MKKIKPKKDELLQQILQEISDENNEIDIGYQENKSQNYNKKISSNRKNIQIMIITVIVLLIIFVLFSPNQKTNKIDHNDTRANTTSILKADQLYKEQEHTVLKKEKKVLNSQNTKTERERAKEILMQQMKN